MIVRSCHGFGYELTTLEIPEIFSNLRKNFGCIIMYHTIDDAKVIIEFKTIPGISGAIR